MAFFTYSIDNKSFVTDSNGNQILNLAESMYNNDYTQFTNYRIKRVTSEFVMRPDLVAISEYQDQDATEFILKWSGISNPFSLNKDDLLKIPAEQSMKAGLLYDNPLTKPDERAITIDKIKNYFKYVNTDYDGDMSSYKNVLNKKIPSANINVSETKAYSVPYINQEETASLRIENGRIYFGENAGVTAAQLVNGSTTVEDLDEKIRNIIDSTASVLSDKCLQNGTLLGSLYRAKNKK